MLERGVMSRVKPRQANRDLWSTREKCDQPDGWSLLLSGGYVIVLTPTRFSEGHSGHPLLWMRW